MAAASDERRLAIWLAARSDEGLRAVFVARGVPAHSAWRGFFDAAEGLLDETSIDRALVRLPRRCLAALTGAPTPDGTAALRERALVDAEGEPYAVVRARADAAATVTPQAFTLPADTPAPPLTDRAGAAAAAERALTAGAALADLILAARAGAVTTTGAGTVSAADRKRLLEDGVVGDGDELEDLLATGAAAGLLALIEREWNETARGDEWLPAPALERWIAVVEGLRSALPEGLRTHDGFVPAAAWSGAYPLDPEWPPRAAALRRRIVRWGLLEANGSEPVWGRALRLGAAVDPATLAPLLPAEIDRVYLQADLSAIAPGPLRSGLDLRLRAMADRESRAQASTYRFSADSLGRAIAAGETAASIRAFLSELSLTGLPQPLDYLLERAARHSGRIRVSEDAAAGRTRVSVDDPQLRETIAIDRGLRALGLLPDGDTLVSRVPRDAVYWSLIDARYLAIAVDGEGTPTPLRRGKSAAGEASDAHDYDALIAKLRAASEGDTDAAWLERELDQAVRARAMIEVVVRLPSGDERSFTLEASGLGGGRLRGLDRAGDVERTLPVSSIVSVRPAP